jgi:3-oxoacyl-[acyl-carrier protein] reductase
VDLGLSGRVALVCAASKGIGFGIARTMANEGARIAITSRSQERVGTAAAEIGARGYVHDSADLDAIPGLVGRVEEEIGPIDVLVTNTGGPPYRLDPLSFSREEWEEWHRRLVVSPLTFIETVLPGMRERGFGRILNVSSTSVRTPLAGLMLSNAERSALLAAFKTIALETAADGVTLNTLLTGWIATDRILDAGGTIEEAEETARTTIPAARLGTIDEMGAAAAFLASEHAGYITGAALPVDGGSLQST